MTKNPKPLPEVYADKPSDAQVQPQTVQTVPAPSYQIAPVNPSPMGELAQASYDATMIQRVAEAAAVKVANAMMNQKNKLEEIMPIADMPDDMKHELAKMRIDDMRIKQQLALADHFIQSGAFTKDVQNAGQAFVKIQYGSELGMSPAEAMTGLYLVNGNVTMWGATFTRRLASLGWRLEYPESTNEIATVRATKGDRMEEETARKEDVMKGKAYGFAPKDKLKWHAIARLCRFKIPEALGNVRYITEEMIEGDLSEEVSTAKMKQEFGRKAITSKAKEILDGTPAEESISYAYTQKLNY